jgi:hypothetical protein
MTRPILALVILALATPAAADCVSQTRGSYTRHTCDNGLRGDSSTRGGVTETHWNDGSRSRSETHGGITNTHIDQGPSPDPVKRMEERMREQRARRYHIGDDE